MQISGLGRKSVSDILCSSPAAAMSSIYLISSPAPQLLSSFAKALQRYTSKRNGGTAVANRRRDQKSTQTSPCVFWWAGHSAETRMPPPEDTCHDVWRSTAGSSPFSHPRPGSIALRGPGSQAASFVLATRLGDLQSPPLPHPHPGSTSSSGKLIKAAMAGDSESARRRQGTVLD